MPPTKAQHDGRVCEISKEIEYQINGCMIEPTGRGSDFLAVCPNSKPTLVEVKKGCGSLSRLQMETRDKVLASGIYDYKIERCSCLKTHK